jgi:hypothetical protein
MPADAQFVLPDTTDQTAVVMVLSPAEKARLAAERRWRFHEPGHLS